MANSLFSLAQPFFTALDPEKAHTLAIVALKAGIHPRCSNDFGSSLAQNLFGLDFPNPIGIAAGFDKNAEVPDALIALGMGFSEVGSITPKPQAGNPKPRIFRVSSKRGVINRLGFNNEGHAAAHARLKARTQKAIVGVNIGANKDTEDKTLDYVEGIKAFADVAAYFVINISSPNTPGLRGLQERGELDALLNAVLAQRDQSAAEHGRIPVLVKIAPDLSANELEDIVEVCLKHQIDGAIVSNTTISRETITGAENAEETGGLSGAPVFDLSTHMLARFYVLSEEKIPLIGVGGVGNAATAYEKIKAGASLVQLYTGMIYGGVGLVEEILTDLVVLVKNDGHTSIAEAIGTKASEWASKQI